jgi:hypothetical protein
MTWMSRYFVEALGMNDEDESDELEGTGMWLRLYSEHAGAELWKDGRLVERT